MPREKTTRNPLGTILKSEIVVVKFIGGKEKKIKQTVYDARKRYTDPEGKKRQKFKRCYTSSEATTALTNFANEIANEFLKAEEAKHSDHIYTFFELCDYFQKNYCKPAVFVGKRQISGYRQNYKNIETYLADFKSFFGDVQIGEITYEKVREFAEMLAQTPIKPLYGNANKKKMPSAGTVNRKLAYLRRLFNVGIRARMVPSRINPFSEGETLIESKLESPRNRALTFEEERRLLDICSQDFWEIPFERYGKQGKMKFENPHKYLKLVIILAIDTGLRKGEIFKLQREDIWLEDEMIYLPWWKTKALRDRYIPMSARLLDELKKYFSEFPMLPKASVFFGQKDCKKAFAQACSRAGIKDFTFHDLRHTAATNMDQAGISLSVRKNIIGHTSDNVHQRYNNMTEDVAASIREKINSFREKIESSETYKESPKTAKIVGLGK